MSTLLEKTFLRLDVLTIDICYDAQTADRIAALAGGGRLDGEARDSIVRAVLAGDSAAARIEFARDIGQDRFLDGIIDDQRRAVDAGLIAAPLHEAVKAGLPVWFAFLESRGVRKGDQIAYEIRTDAIRTIYADAEGTILLDQTDFGQDWRNSVLATWLAPGASLRSGLLRSLEREEARTVAAEGVDRCVVRAAPGQPLRSSNRMFSTMVPLARPNRVGAVGKHDGRDSWIR